MTWYREIDLSMSNKTYLKVVCATEASGELDEPTPLKRRYWVHPLKCDREKNNNFSKFYENIRKHPENFVEYYRMSVKSFDELLATLRKYLSKEITNMRNPLSPERELTVTKR